ncbi:MAG TPA: hypothetical protein VHR66_08510 [Gemmataceae bacterium]|jgi:hypothetical protein|nr:hypothetical protein [Gemmataceae bacterium]
MRAVVTGMIGSYPVGGVAWDYGQYALGLERLGFEVYYLEDTGWQTYDPIAGCYGDDCRYAVHSLENALTNLSPTLGRRWHFRNLDGRTFGMPAAAVADIVAGADLFLNVSGGTLLRDEYMSCRRKVLIDTDPGWNHFRNFPRWDNPPDEASRKFTRQGHGYRAHEFFFTYAERLGRPDCLLPSLGLPWQSTRPPVVIDCWRPEPPGDSWTTVMTWKNFAETIAHEGVVYGTKEMEFDKIEELPRLSPARFEVACGGDPPRDRWRSVGWSVVVSQAVSVTPEMYRSYIQRSRGELSVAKNVYVATGSGWFSCRTACYLAAGRPAVVQDTGFSRVIPTGRGLFAFTDAAEALSGIDAIESDYEAHQAAARELAQSHFDSNRVLGDLLSRIGLE